MKSIVQRIQSVGYRVLAVLVPMLCVTGCHSKPDDQSAHASDLPVARVRVQTVQSERRPITEEVAGTIRAKLHATLEAKVSGRIQEFPIVLGQAVKAGELIARLAAPEITARLEQAEASFGQAERDWKRASALFERQAVTRAEYDAAESRFHSAKAGVMEANAMAGYVEVLAPFDGVVTKKWAETGDLAAPGKPLISVEDPSVQQLEADVPEKIAGHIQLEQRMAVRVDGVDQALTATVREIAPAADPLSRTVRVRLQLPMGERFMSGRFARLVAPIGERQSLRVPAPALVKRGQLEIVFVADDGRARLHLVKAGGRWGEEVEILSGLDAGDAVVVEGAAQLTDGQPVEVQ